jgi:hypothetical protein
MFNRVFSKLNLLQSDLENLNDLDRAIPLKSDF